MDLPALPLSKVRGSQDTATPRSVSHRQSLNCSRSLLFCSFPVEVCGSSATTTNASGTCHGAKFCCRKERNSQGSTVRFSFRPPEQGGAPAISGVARREQLPPGPLCVHTPHSQVRPR